MDGRHTDADKQEVIKDFLQKLADSGYTHPTRKEIITSAVRKYYRQILEQETGGRQLYRSSQEMAEGRKMKALQNMSWFKSRRGGKSITPLKDLPHYTQEQELQERRMAIRKDKAARKQETAGTNTEGEEETGVLNQEKGS